MPALLDRLAENLDHTLGSAAEVIAEIGDRQDAFDEIFEGMFHADPHLTARAVNVIEKVSRKHPHLLQPHKEQLLMHFDALFQGISMKISLPLLMGYIDWEEEELGKALEILEDKLHTEANKFTKVTCLQGLADQAMKHPWLKPEVMAMINGQMQEGSASIKARGRKLLKKLE